jgi:hypothetical protein
LKLTLIKPITFWRPKMKRKTNSRDSVDGNGQPDTKKRALSSEEVALRFRDGLFEPSVQENYTKLYAESGPYV